MSICQVESFYDAIKKCRTKDAVLKRARQEVEYLNARTLGHMRPNVFFLTNATPFYRTLSLFAAMCEHLTA